MSGKRSGRVSGRQQLGTRDSSSYRTRNDRAKSGSPTHYYRSQIDKKDQLYDKVNELNVFIYKGIEKFLDKQAVRDLITAYDNDDIFINGEAQFYESFGDGFDDDDDFQNGTTNPNMLHVEKKKFQNLAVTMFGMAKNSTKDERFPPNGKSGGGGPKKQPVNRNSRSRRSTQSLIVSFLGMVRIKLFGIKWGKEQSPNKNKRRVSDVFEREFP